MEVNKIICGNCEEVLKKFPDNSIDTIITDPPYGLKFMGKKWDYDVPSVETWQECLRVLKPGGTTLIFAGSRTQHRMAVNVEDAGFILKDTIELFFNQSWIDFYETLDREQKKMFSNLSSNCNMFWLYGSGFPKATDISKQIDKMAGKKGKEIDYIAPDGKKRWGGNSFSVAKPPDGRGVNKKTLPATLKAKLWNGWKSHGLKPAYEPILVCMKPNEGSYANNALKWGVAGLNIDGGRIEHNEPLKKTNRQKNTGNSWNKNNCGLRNNPNNMASADQKGRYPANIILDEESARLLDEQAPKTGAFAKVKSGHSGKSKGIYHDYAQRGDNGETFYADGLQGASRFFYCAKASKAERNRGCEGLESKAKCEIDKMGGSKCTIKTGSGNERNVKYKNNHPTVKPLALMKYLCTLTKTPTGGIVLDPFAGSGTTLMACKELKRDYIGIEKDPEYIEIARRRIKAIPEKLF